jgi:hypothetical protein
VSTACLKAACVLVRTRRECDCLIKAL